METEVFSIDAVLGTILSGEYKTGKIIEINRGIRTGGLTLDLRDNVLTIEGRVHQDVGHDRFLLKEYETGSFRREFRLTNLIDQDGIDASLSDGVLRLTLPKAEAARPRKIEVRAG